ncbi:MAG: TolC family protein [Rhodoferax sp.]|nr:TolC family protein [Rhodoferax sp.]
METLFPAFGGSARHRGHPSTRRRQAFTTAHIAVLIGLAMPPITRAQEPLSLPQAVQAALVRAPALGAQDAAALSARNMAVAAGQRPDPILRLSLDNVPVSGPDRFSTTRDFMTAKLVSLTQTLPNAAKRQARTARFEREAQTAEAARMEQAAHIGRETALAWWERHAQEQRVVVLHEQLREARLLVQASEAAARSGSGSPADWIAARESVAQLQQVLLGVEAEQHNARLSLARWTGDTPDQLLANPPDLTSPPIAMGDPAERLAHHPELVRLSAQEAALAAAAEVARQEREPDWSAELMLSLRGSGYPNMVSLAVSLPLPWDRPQRQDRELAARLAQLAALRAEREERAREHLVEARRWQEGWRSGVAQLALIDGERLPLAEQRIQTTLAAYRGGRTPLSEVLAARRMALALRMERIDLQRSTARLWAQLAYLIPAGPAAAPGVTP